MKIWKKGEGFKFNNSNDCFGESFELEGANLNIAVITIKSRYPEKGYAYNIEAQEMAYVVRGSGSVEVKYGKNLSLSQGDVVYFAEMEKIAWDGDMVLVVPCGPAFDPNKHKFTD